MERIAMSQQERDELDWLKRAKEGSISQRDAAQKMGVSDRWVRTLLKRMDHPYTMRTMLPKLARSYALDAVEAPNAPAAATSGVAEFLARVGKSEPLIRPAVGMGEDVRLTGEGVSGAALRSEQRYIHLCAFTTNGASGPVGFRTSISRPARRRAR